MATLLMIHGACHGGWAYDFMRPHLEAAGHELLTPTLTGMSERVNELTPKVTAITHANDIVAAIHRTKADSIILIGHSYAGGPMTHAHSLAGDRIQQLIYLDAFVPEHKRSLFDVIAPEDQQKWRALARKADSFYVEPNEDTVRTWGIEQQDWIDYVMPKLSPFAIPWYEPALEHGDKFQHIKKTYIRFSKPNGLDSLIASHGERARQLGMDYVEHYGHHEALLTDAEAVAKLILKHITPTEV